MIPYFVVLFLILVFAIADQASKNNAWKVLAFVLLAFFAGFRFNVGIDYESYVKIYDEVEGSFVSEPGNKLLFSFIKLIGGKAQLYFLIMACITQFFVYKTLTKIKKGFWLSVFVYYCISLLYMASFNAVRQYAAIAIIAWSLQFVEKEQFKKFCTIVILVTLCFHFSAIIFIPLYFFLKRRHSMMFILLILVGVVLCNRLMWEVISLTPYVKYLEHVESGRDREIKVEMIQYMFAMFSFFMVLIENKFKYLRENMILCNMNALCLYTMTLVTLQTIGSMIMLFQRYNNYFIFSYLLIIPAVMNSMNPKNAIAPKILVVIISLLYFARTIIINGEKHVLVPYDVDLILFNF